MIDGQPLPEMLSDGAETMLRGIEWRHSRGRQPPERWFTTLADLPHGGVIRDEVRALPRQID